MSVKRKRALSKEDNIYDLVERAAAPRKVPRLKLWQKTAQALVSGELSALNLSEVLQPRAYPTLTLAIWLPGFRAAIDRGNEPSRFAHILDRIIVRSTDIRTMAQRGEQVGEGG